MMDRVELTKQSLNRCLAASEEADDHEAAQKYPEVKSVSNINRAVALYTLGLASSKPEGFEKTIDETTRALSEFLRGNLKDNYLDVLEHAVKVRMHALMIVNAREEVEALWRDWTISIQFLRELYE